MFVYVPVRVTASPVPTCDRERLDDEARRGRDGRDGRDTGDRRDTGDSGDSGNQRRTLAVRDRTGHARDSDVGTRTRRTGGEDHDVATVAGDREVRGTQLSMMSATMLLPEVTPVPPVSSRHSSVTLKATPARPYR